MSASPLAHITDRVRERIRREGVDPGADAALAGRLIQEEVQRYSERALGGSLPMPGDESALTRQVAAAITGLGPLQVLLDDPEIEEIWINAPDRVFVARNGVSGRIPSTNVVWLEKDIPERKRYGPHDGCPRWGLLVSP